MKDYIDKLRSDYHRKKLNKFSLGGAQNIQQYRTGDVFRKKQPLIFEDDAAWGLIDPNANKNTTYTEPAENDWSYAYTEKGIQDANNLDAQLKRFEELSTTKSNPPPTFIGDDQAWGPIDPNANKNTTYTEPAENDWSYAYTEKGIQDANDLGIGIKDSDKIALTPEQKEEFDKMEAKFQKQRKKRLEDEARKNMQGSQPQGFFVPPNGDLTTNLYNLGRAIGAEKGTKGRGASIVGNTGAAILEGSRALFSGMGFSKAQQYTDQFNQDQMIAARKKYESNPQYKNANYIGGPSQARLGGKFGYFEEGGEQQQMDPRMEQMMAQQGEQQADPRMQQQQMDPRMMQQQQQQMDPRMQQQQEAQMTEQESQAYQQIAEKLVNSFETLDEIAEYLKENGVDEAAFNAILNFAEDMMEDKEESLENSEEATEETEEEGEMRKGGTKFNKKVGEYIEFEYGGKTYKGTIKSIKNGQIFLK